MPHPPLADLKSLAIQNSQHASVNHIPTRRNSQATNGTAREGHKAVRAALIRRAAALAVDVAVGDDGAGRRVDLETLPVDARRRAVAVARRAGVTVSTQQS